MDFTMDDVMEVLKIIKECRDAELHIDTGDMKLSVFKGDAGDSGRSMLNFSNNSSPACQPAPQAPEAVQAAPAAETANPQEAAAPLPVESAAAEESEEGLIPIKASVTSVFYRRPSPSEPPYVEVGDSVADDSVLGLLEVMKCFRQITAGMQGVVAKICAESNSLVEEGATLFLIRPA